MFAENLFAFILISKSGKKTLGDAEGGGREGEKKLIASNWGVSFTVDSRHDPTGK